MTIQQHDPESEPSSITPCSRWPAKRVYLTADEASLALRAFWWQLVDEGHYPDRGLSVYQCDGAGWFYPHFHLGRARGSTR